MLQLQLGIQVIFSINSSLAGNFFFLISPLVFIINLKKKKNSFVQSCKIKKIYILKEYFILLGNQKYKS